METITLKTKKREVKLTKYELQIIVDAIQAAQETGADEALKALKKLVEAERYWTDKGVDISVVRGEDNGGKRIYTAREYREAMDWSEYLDTQMAILKKVKGVLR